MKYEAVIFDLDGTLVNSIPLYKQAYLETLRSFGLRLTEPEFNTIYWENRKLTAVAKKFGLSAQADEIRTHRNALYVDTLRKNVTWYPDALAMLQTWNMPKPPVVVTDSWRSFTDAIDARLGLSEYIPLIVTADDAVPHEKPHPHSLQHAAARIGVAPEKCLYVGDQMFDIGAARNADMDHCLIVREHTPPTAVRSANRIIHSLEELLAEL
ncbi:MAG: HAD family phosphatase [Candidatus Peribacteraceae bacterium]|nr:HAD family phosphatase [Candidatus Peribacteraceae bacterium]